MNDNNQVIDFLDDMYGSAPWMGTLRHVKHENKVTASLPKPQFKRYPDEDAPNPFEGIFLSNFYLISKIIFGNQTKILKR